MNAHICMYLAVHVCDNADQRLNVAREASNWRRKHTRSVCPNCLLKKQQKLCPKIDEQINR